MYASHNISQLHVSAYFYGAIFRKMWSTYFNNNCLIQCCVRLYIIHIYTRQKNEDVELCKRISLFMKYGRGISVDVVAWLWAVFLEVWRFDFQQRSEKFLVTETSRPALGPTRIGPEGYFTWNKAGRGVKLITYSFWYRNYEGADKSLARPGRKKSTATEYSEFHLSYF
jgi:hypothetical protein